MLRRRILLATAFALVTAVAGTAAVFDKAVTVPRGELETFAWSVGGLRINNVALRKQAAAFKKDLYNLEVSMSVRNGSVGNRSLTVMVVGLGEKGQVLWSTSASPPFYTAASGATATMKSAVYVPDGVLAKTRRLWLRAVGHHANP